ncbi:hypothetical protein [Paenibacillus agilis]|uniref:Uncharacterized protein n=1 Tax=Paenibacillus agilis TaxID=3020863 RepID=A0A559IXB2_9BACL|nr:hypothetical protein [Paenibacillus agilis]TVX92270.1 hypothetical protein FPZ44_03845 [Paenibacillus agilis]
MNEEELRQWVQNRLNHNLSTEQTEQLIQFMRDTATRLQEAFLVITQNVTNVLDTGDDMNRFKQLTEYIQEKPKAAYRSKLVQAPGYNRTEFDRWRSRLGQGRGKRKK